MSEPWLAAMITIAGGVVVYAVGHLCVALFVEPIHRLRSLIGEIADSLVFYANVYSNPEVTQTELCDEASEALRRLAGQLKARAYTIPWYSLWSLLRLVRQKTEIEESSAELIGLSNSVHGGPSITGLENDKKRIRIEELLGIRSSKKQREGQSMDRYTLAEGTLLVLFAMILLGLQNGTLVLLGHEIFTIPIQIYTALGIIAVVVAFSLVVTMFWKQLRVKLRSLLQRVLKSWWQSISRLLKWLHWVVFWLVYIAGWLQGLSRIPAEGVNFEIAFWIGFVWFWIIPIVWFKIIVSERKPAKSEG